MLANTFFIVFLFVPGALFLSPGIIAPVVAAGVAVAEVDSTPPVVISEATVIDVHTGAETVSDILIEGQRIAAVEPHGSIEIPADSKIINANGKYAIPGLWDMHVHLTFIPELEDRVSRLFIVNGVTSVRDMGGKLEDILAFRRKARQPGAIAPYIWIAGPLVDGWPPVFDGEHQKPAMSVAVTTPDEGIRLVDKLFDSGVDLIKPYEMLRPEVLSAVVKRAHQHGLPVDGHLPMRVTTQQAMAAGMDGIQHLTWLERDCAKDPAGLQAENIAILDQSEGSQNQNYERAVAARRQADKVVKGKAFASQDPIRCAGLIAGMAKKGIWRTPMLAVSAFTVDPRWSDALRYVPKTVRKEKQRISALLSSPQLESHYRVKHEWMFKTVAQMHRAGVKILAGTDTLLVPGFSLHQELEELVRVGLSPLEALRSATIDPARFFSVDNEQGSIDAGKVADIVMLDANPLAAIANSRQIHTVIARGRVYDRQSLDELKAAMLE